jgi:alpha-mannosidase
MENCGRWAFLAQCIGSRTDPQGPLAVSVFNPSGWERTDTVLTGRIYPIREKAKGIVVRDKTGRAVPSQMIKREADPQGNLVVAELAFVAEQVPSVGYDTYYLELTPDAAPAQPTDLRCDESRMELENQYLQLKLDPATGAICSLIDKRNGRQMLSPAGGAFPVFHGRPNASYPLRTVFDPSGGASTPFYDSGKSKAQILLRARVALGVSQAAGPRL